MADDAIIDAYERAYSTAQRYGADGCDNEILLFVTVKRWTVACTPTSPRSNDWLMSLGRRLMDVAVLSNGGRGGGRFGICRQFALFGDMCYVRRSRKNGMPKFRFPDWKPVVRSRKV